MGLMPGMTNRHALPTQPWLALGMRAEVSPTLPCSRHPSQAFGELMRVGNESKKQFMLYPTARLVQGGQGRVLWAMNGRLRLGILPVRLFANGNTFFLQRVHLKPGAVQPVLVHNTFQARLGAASQRARNPAAALTLLAAGAVLRGVGEASQIPVCRAVVHSRLRVLEAACRRRAVPHLGRRAAAQPARCVAAAAGSPGVAAVHRPQPLAQRDTPPRRWPRRRGAARPVLGQRHRRRRPQPGQPHAAGGVAPAQPAQRPSPGPGAGPHAAHPAAGVPLRPVLVPRPPRLSRARLGAGAPVRVCAGSADGREPLGGAGCCALRLQELATQRLKRAAPTVAQFELRIAYRQAAFLEARRGA